jgi:hypothetical protein
VVLDPNYGMFIYERLAGAKSVNAALNYLFGKPTRRSRASVLNDIDYEILAKRRGDRPAAATAPPGSIRRAHRARSPRPQLVDQGQ